MGLQSKENGPVCDEGCTLYDLQHNPQGFPPGDQVMGWEEEELEVVEVVEVVQEALMELLPEAAST